MSFRSQTPRIVRVLAFATLLVAARLAAQEVDTSVIGSAYECSMDCHDEALGLWESYVFMGDADIADQVAYDDYMDCVGDC